MILFPFGAAPTSVAGRLPWFYSIKYNVTLNFHIHAPFSTAAQIYCLPATHSQSECNNKHTAGMMTSSTCNAKSISKPGCRECVSVHSLRPGRRETLGRGRETHVIKNKNNETRGKLRLEIKSIRQNIRKAGAALSLTCRELCLMQARGVLWTIRVLVPRDERVIGHAPA
jgi:hypothetical protein